MSKLFHYDKELVLHVKPFLYPPDPPTSTASLAQVAQLEANGFTCLWGVDRASQMHRFGMLQARTYCDGGLWPYERARWKSDGLARWGLKTDVDYFEDLVTALNGGERASPNMRLEDHVFGVLTKLTARGMALDAEKMAALEAVVRLGSGAAVLSYLETM